MKRFAILITVLMLALGSDVLAQGCSICTKTAQNLDARSAHGLNTGIIYLAMLPLGIIGTVGFMWWRTRPR
jgi:hypothetical protein